MNLPHAARALRNRDFAKLWLGLGVSQTGSQITQVAIAWQLYLLTHSALSLGLVGLARFLAVTLMALFGGVVADAVDRRRLIIAVQGLLALNSAGLAALTLSGRTSASALYAFAFVSGLLGSFDNPARQALMTNLVPPEELPNALSLSTSAWQIATVAGPTLGGAFLAFGGAASCYLVDAASFLAMAVATWTIAYRPTRLVRTGALSFRAMGEGLRFLSRARVVLWLMLLDAVGCFFAGSMMLMPIYADRLLHVGPKGLGLLYAAPAAGAVVAALAMAGRAPVRRQGLVVLGSVTAYGLLIAGFGLSRDFGLSLAFLAASGAADTVSMIVRQTVRQLLTPDGLRGRTTAVNMIFVIGGPQLGEFEGGVVARAFGAPFSVVSGGLACAAIALGFAALVPSIRSLRDIGGLAPAGPQAAPILPLG